MKEVLWQHAGNEKPPINTIVEIKFDIFDISNCNYGKAYWNGIEWLTPKGDSLEFDVIVTDWRFLTPSNR
jgi:hypothetical protein